MEGEEYLVELNNKPNIDLLSLNGFKYKIDSINMAVVELTLDIRASGIIKKIYPNNSLNIYLKNVRESIGIDYAYNKGITGKNIGIAIMDTGVSPIEDFDTRIIGFKDFINNKSSPYDDNGHGTHVTGIASGSGRLSLGIYRGIAPRSNIIAVKVLDKYGRGNSIAAIMGIQWIIENKDKYNIKIINMSAGTTDKAINVPLVRAAENAVENGIAVIAADGNGNFNSIITSPGISPNIITVGSSEDYPSERLYRVGTFFSRKSYKKPDIYAPGNEIVSCLSPDFMFDGREGRESKICNSYYIKMSGSSMATPVISGISALILEKYPDITPKRLKQILLRGISEKAMPPIPDIIKILNL